MHGYTVSVDETLTSIGVKACFDGPAPTRLEAVSRRARDYLVEPHAWRDDARVLLSIGPRGLRTGAIGTDGCVGYRVDAAGAIDDGVDRNGARTADIAIRAETDGRHSLATALDGLQACCLPAGRRWSARQLVDRIDAITGTGVMTRLYEKHVNDRSFPNLDEEYHQLGLSVDGERITLEASAPLAAVRSAIMRPATGPPRGPTNFEPSSGELVQ